MKNHQLIMPMFKPLKRFKSPKAHVDRIRKQISSELCTSWANAVSRNAREESLVHKNKPKRKWIYDRGYYYAYNPFFSQGLGKFFKKSSPLSIHNAIEIIAQETHRGTKNNPLQILEDGAGKALH